MNPTSRADPAKAQADPCAPRHQDPASIRALDAIRLLHSAGAALLDQSALYARLLQIEWVREKHRLTQMLVFSLLGFACLLCVMLMLAVLVMAQSWDTAYRLHAAFGLVVFYALAAELARRRLRTLAAAGAASFAASRAEWAADIALMRSKL